SPRPGSSRSAWAADRSTLTALPFATSFNTGHGTGWYERGERTGDAPWNHLGLQDRLPGRRWVIHTDGSRPQVSFDFSDAWRGGTSLLVDGALGSPATVELFTARLPISDTTVVELAHRTDPGSGGVRVELAVSTEEPYRFTYIDAGVLPAGGRGWSTATLRLGRALRGAKARTLRAVGIRLTAADGAPVRWRLGSLAIRDTQASGPRRPGGLKVTAARRGADGTAALRLSWGRASGPVRHYELHQVLPGGARRFLGGTCGTAFYVPSLRRASQEAATRVELRTVDELFASSDPVFTTFHW
ncbi:endo-beta-N-acetylglucosaminidase, partial [Streptomyces sp. NPDC057654]